MPIRDAGNVLIGQLHVISWHRNVVSSWSNVKKKKKRYSFYDVFVINAFKWLLYKIFWTISQLLAVDLIQL